MMKRPACLLSGLVLFVSLGAHGSTLLDLYHETMASDPRLQRAEAESAVYQARKDYTFGGLLPQVALNAQGSRTARKAPDAQGLEQEDYYNGERYYVSLAQPLYDKARWEAFRSARKESSQYSARFEETQSLVAVDLVDRYTKVLAAEDNHVFVRAEREAAQEQLKQVSARYKRQLAKITDLLAVEARTNVLLSQELDALNQVSIAREAMSELLGREVTESVATLRDEVDVDWELTGLGEWIKKGLANNKQLQSSRLAVETARGRVKEASAGHHPTVSLNLNAQESDIGYENAQAPKTESYVASVNLTMPIYSGGQVNSRIAEAQARLRMAEQEYEQSERLLRKSIREAFLNANSAMQRVDATHNAVISAEKSYEAQQKGFQYGTVTVVDVLNASETLYEARRDYRQAYYDLMVQGMTLFQVAGEFSPEKMADINGWLTSSEQAGL